jgi:hypothetical protein
MVIKQHCPHCGHKLTIDRTEYFVSAGCENCFEYWQVIETENCCLKPEYQHVRFTDEAGRAHVRKQCNNCGNINGSSLGGFTKEQKDALPDCDKAKRDDYQTKRWDLIQGFYQKRRDLQEARKLQAKAEWWESYNEYLNSPQWKAKRALILKRDNHTCQACLKNEATEVHHRSYEFVDFTGKEPCFDLVAICHVCHERLHHIRNQRKAS